MQLARGNDHGPGLEAGNDLQVAIKAQPGFNRARLRPAHTATTVRLQSGKSQVLDGPFIETREQLGGYFLIDAKNLDEAIAVAVKIPMARKGTVEVRPVIEMSGLPNP